MARSIPRLLALSGLLAIPLACGGNDAADRSPASTCAPAGGEPGAPDPGRVVALDEELLLADMLALGIEPVASTATTADVGFQGLDDYDTSAIEPLPSNEPNFERLASFRPDTIVVAQFVIDAIGREELDALGRVVVVPISGGPDQLDIRGSTFGWQEQAADLAVNLKAAESGAAGTGPAGCTASLATVYPGPSPAAWVAGPNAAALALRDMGCALSPSAQDAEPDFAGRLRVSLEQVGLRDAATLVLLHSHTVEGEEAALEELSNDPIWQQLPAVQAGDVTQLDRLGYPGVEGRIRLYRDLDQALEAS